MYLCTFGKTEAGKIHIAIEAKVDEFFSDKIGKVYAAAKKRAINSNSQQQKRIEELCETICNTTSPNEVADLRYQLLYYVAGSINNDCDICIMLVIVFKTCDYDENKADNNKRDYIKFMERFDKLSSKTCDYDLSRLREDGKFAYAIYSEIDL